LGLAVDSAVVGDDVYLVKEGWHSLHSESKGRFKIAENFNGEDGKNVWRQNTAGSNPLSSPLHGNGVSTIKKLIKISEEIQSQRIRPLLTFERHPETESRKNEWLQSAVEDSEESIVDPVMESSGQVKEVTLQDSPIESFV